MENTSSSQISLVKFTPAKDQEYLLGLSYIVDPKSIGIDVRDNYTKESSSVYMFSVKLQGRYADCSCMQTIFSQRTMLEAFYFQKTMNIPDYHTKLVANLVWHHVMGLKDYLNRVTPDKVKFESGWHIQLEPLRQIVERAEANEWKYLITKSLGYESDEQIKDRTMKQLLEDSFRWRTE